MIPFNNKGAEGEGEYFIEEIVVIPAQVNDSGLILVHVFHQDAEKLGVFLFPYSRFFELPAINNVTVEDEGIAAMLTKKKG
jgi:hypothetical protein